MPKYTEVFVPGGFPRYTYNPRLSLQIEEKVRQVLENLCKLVTVTGHTKSGKTVLVSSVLPRDKAIWIDGGAIGQEEDFWHSIIDQLDIFPTTEASNSKELSAEFTASGRMGANFLIAKGEAEVGGSLAKTHGKGVSRSRTVSARIAALTELRKVKIPIVIDDFHYLRRELQADLVRALKPLIFDGHPVVVIAIPHRRYDVLKVEKEMTGRLLPVEIPSWTIAELDFIPQTGFPQLGGTVSSAVASRLAKESIGSAGLVRPGAARREPGR